MGILLLFGGLSKAEHFLFSYERMVKNDANNTSLVSHHETKGAVITKHHFLPLFNGPDFLSWQM